MTRTQAGVRQVLDKHDVLFSVGGDLFTWSLPSDIDPMPPKGLPLIHLDTDPWQIGKNYPPQVAILGDPKATLPELTAAARRAHVGEREGRRECDGSNPRAKRSRRAPRRSRQGPRHGGQDARAAARAA